MYGSYKKGPGAQKPFGLFLKMSKRFHAYAETFFKKPETFFGELIERPCASRLSTVLNKEKQMSTKPDRRQ